MRSHTLVALKTTTETVYLKAHIHWTGSSINLETLRYGTKTNIRPLNKSYYLADES